MSGFLHQLAKRSLGLEPSVKSRAALPYAAPTATATGLPTLDFGEPSSLPLARIAERPIAPPQAQANRHAERTAYNSLPTPIRPEISGQASRQSQTSDEAANLPAARHSSRTPTEQTAVGHRSLPNTLAKAPASQHDAHTTLNPLPTTNTKARQAIERPVGPETDGRQPTQSPQSSLADLDALVTRLLGEPKDQRSASLDSTDQPDHQASRPAAPAPETASIIRTQAGPRRQSNTPEADTAPEVHITIGRLEVNPPSRPAPPPAPPRPRGPTPLSLSDYLARRNGGRS